MAFVGRFVTDTVPGGGSVGISLLIILLIPAGIYFTIRTRGLPILLFPDMVVALTGKKDVITVCLLSRH